MKSKHTKVEVHISNEPTGLFIKNKNTHERAICHFYDREDAIPNAEIMCESINVTNETGLTPRELQKSHAELLDALKYILEYSENLKIKHPSMSVVNGCAKQAIANATPKQ
jgi:hypothetical protein